MDNKEAAWEDSVDYVTLAKAGGRKGVSYMYFTSMISPLRRPPGAHGVHWCV